LAGALALHLAVLLLFLVESHGLRGRGGDGRRSGGQDGPGVAVAVSLIRARATAHSGPDPAASPDAGLKAMMARQAMRDGYAASPKRTPADGAVGIARLIAAADSAAQAPASAGGDAGDDLFIQVEPCWRKALDSSRVPVTLEVDLSAGGQALAAPSVVWTGPGSGDARRVAVERALEAIAACLPGARRGARSWAGRHIIRFGLSNP
jgi:hypothetical protein